MTDEKQTGFWVFGYGSLMWRPGFDYAERAMARLEGFRRSFCLRSIRYRGTPEAPGLVLGLDAEPGAVCEGVAYRIESGGEAVLAYLRERELVTYSYVETTQRVILNGAGGASAIAYVVDRTHPQYAGALELEAQAQIIARCVGPAGPNWEYLHNTVAHLEEFGIHDPELVRLDAMVRALRAG